MLAYQNDAEAQRQKVCDCFSGLMHRRKNMVRQAYRFRKNNKWHFYLSLKKPE
jgi:hypothetical protein